MRGWLFTEVSLAVSLARDGGPRQEAGTPFRKKGAELRQEMLPAWTRTAEVKVVANQQDLCSQGQLRGFADVLVQRLQRKQGKGESGCLREP